MVAPIMSIKHYVHRTPLNITSGGISNLIIASAEVAPAVANAFDVAEGSILKALYVELWVTGQGSSGTTGAVNFTIEKVPSDAVAMTAAQAANLGSYPNKKNIMYATQGNFGSVANGPNPFNLFKGWIKIPRGKQRMGAGDKWHANVNASVQTLQVCGFFTYKEYK